MIRSGKFRQYASIEHFVQLGPPTAASRGLPQGEWRVLYSDVPMSIEPLGGSLVEVKRQLVPKASHQVWTRWLDGVKAGMRLRYGDRYFQIGFVDDGDFRQHDLGLVCVEVAKETVNG